MKVSSHFQSVRYHPTIALYTLIISICIVSLNTGLTIPYTTFRLKALGASDFVIATIAATPALGIVLMAFLANRLTRQFRIKQLFVWSTVLLTLSILPLHYIDHFGGLFLLRLLTGLSCSLLIILGEACVNDLATDENRGKIVSIYTTFFTIFQILGPLLLSFFGSESIGVLWLLFVFHVLGLLITMWSPMAFDFHEHGQKSRSLWFFMKVVPAIMLAIFLFAFFDTAVLSIMPIYSMEYGYSAQVAVLIVSVIFIGDACLQIPFGWLSDSIGRIKVHVLCGVGLLISTIIMPVMMQVPALLWPMLFIWGAFAGSVYTIGLVRVGDYFEGPDLVCANACIGLVWGLGGLFAPGMSLGLMNIFGNDGLIWGIVALTILFLASFIKKGPQKNI